jgi:putative CRISPR-associated protein (TIGR02619 family)
MRHLILSPCGTSIFTNKAPEEVRKLLNRHANATQPTDIAPAELRDLELYIEAAIANLLAQTNISELTQQSAELAAVTAIYGGQLGSAGGKDHHILLATDTWLSEQAAKAVEQVLQKFGHSTEVMRHKNLRTNDLDGFRAASGALVEWAYTTLPNYRDSGYRILFNLTGGFKAVQGFLQTLGTILADECVYLYERSNQLIRIPRLPIQMQADEPIRRNVTVMRRLATELKVETAQAQALPELMWMPVDTTAMLSEWGEIVWREVKHSIYTEQLHPSPSPMLHFGAHFVTTLQGLNGQRIRQINEKIDDLARYLESNRTINPPSLDFKELKGGARQGSTHEIDAWRDGSAKRLFGHFDRIKPSHFIIDRLDNALH